MDKLKKPLQQDNHYNVPMKKWRNWPDLCQRVFNEVYSTMDQNQTLFLHPKAKGYSKAHWNTTAWNGAWTAADAAQKALKDIIKAKGYAKA